MNTVLPQAPGRPGTDDTLRDLHDEIVELADKGIDVFVFATEGRLLDASPRCRAQMIEQIAAMSSGLVNGARGYGDRARVGAAERLVVRYAGGALVLLPVNNAIWVGTLTAPARVGDTAHTLALWADRVAPLVPQQLGLSLPAVEVSEAWR